MAAVKTKRISTLIESQLPEFISTEYELFSKFVQKYYEAQEVQGGTLDIISNIQKYADIDFYEKNLLKQNDTLAVSISDTDTTIVVEDASSFPAKNGYIRIGDEIIFYATRTDTEFQECSRGVSGNTTLGDLYTESNFSSTDVAPHAAGVKVYNVSNLFLYAFVKNFESQYLGSFPEKYLRGEVDKRTLIKNINKFYKAKGTDSSIKFIFNTIVSQDVNNKPEVYKPKDFTYKASKSDWINVYALKVKVISGDPTELIGKQIVQPETEEYGYVSATVDNARAEGTFDGEKIWNIVLAPETVTGEFAISTKTRLEKNLLQTDGVGKRVDVFSTIGWEETGEILIGEETIKFDDKNITQFTISKRGDITYNHQAGDSVYKPVVISGSNVKLLTLGVVYNFEIADSHPYSAVDDTIEISNPGFESADPKIVRTGTNQPRWVLNSSLPINAPTVPYVGTQLGQTSTDVSAIFADDQYYYITSSGYPSYQILDGSTVSQTVEDQKLLRIIRKQATRTTEKYKTPKSEVGILLNGVRLYGYRDTESIRYGKLEEIVPSRQGSGYAKPPFVLLDGAPNKARAVLSGSVVERYIVDTNNTFPRTPVIEVTSGRGASVRAVVTGDKITSLVIDNPGEYYSSPPIVRITDSNGKGRFAEYNAVVDTDGRLVDFEKIAEGNFYDQRTVKVDIIAVGNGAVGTPLLKEWNFNRYEKLKSNLDTENGYLFANYNITFEYGYGQVANPKALRVALNDNLSSSGLEPATKTHSPIIGFAYDGNPIYGPFAHENPLDSASPIVRMTSSYVRNSSRSGGPSLSSYPLGSFTNDYTYRHKSGSLDENNGRFCVTPDFPEGTYAYFLTIDSNQAPQYPYVLGENFYSLPVDSNYNSDINQNDVPKASKRFSTPGMQGNGSGIFAKINEVKPGTVDNITIENSSENFSVNSKVYFDNKGTNGSEAEALVNSVKGKPVSYIDSYENKVVKLTTIQNAYLFADDILRQPSSSASGQIVGTVRNDNEIVLKNVVGTFDNTGTFSADIKTFFILLDQDSSYSQGAILSLTDGINPTVAKGEVLNGTSNQNVVEIKVVPLNPDDDPQDWDYGDWFQFNQGEYFLQSDNFFNTSGTRPVTLTSLSDGLEPFEVNQSVALVETVGNHGLGIDDKVDISILPDDTTKTKTYYLRKRLYQNVVFKAPKYSTAIDDTGVGRFQILNGGADYAPGTYNNVPLTGGSGTGATAIVVVSDAGVVSSVSIQEKGTGYRKADYLGVDDESLSRSLASQSTQRLTMYVDHVGFAAGSTRLIVSSTTGVAEGDTILIGEEVIEVATISGNTLTVLRGREGTLDKDHYNKQPVNLYKPKLNFDPNFKLGDGNSAYIASYNSTTQEATLVYDYEVELNTAVAVTISTTFFDDSVPSRLVSVQSLEPIAYKFEFSEDNIEFTPNPNLDIQELYRYVFDTSHSSLTGTYFDLSPSKNFNIITTEKLASNTLPGNAGAFTEVKFGFGSRISSNNYSVERGTDFTNFYYFDKNGIVNAEGSFLKIVKDPLQGEKRVIYVTPNRFVYNVSSEPLWDGSGSISYTTTGQFAIGEINDFKITNLGLNYKKVPIVSGVAPTQSYKASATVLYDLDSQLITSVVVDERGSNYSNPKVIITDGDGVDAKFDVVLRGGQIFAVNVANPGSGYTYAPTIEIVESDVEAYVDSSTIGIPQSVSIIRNGGAFHLDKTVASNFTSKYTVALTAPEQTFGEFIAGITPTIEKYSKGEVVIQKSYNNNTGAYDGPEVMRAKVAEFREGTNLLKLESITGIIRNDLPIVGLVSKARADVKAVYATTFKEKITSFFDNIGYYASDRGKLGVSNQKITDSFFYQDYSYVVKSKTPIDQWRELIKSTTHPAGFKLFGQVDIETDAAAEMPVEMPKASHFTVIQLWDPNKNKITVENTRRTITQTVQKVENQRIKKGVGSAATSEFNFNESRAFTVYLTPDQSKPDFDGYDGAEGIRYLLPSTKDYQVGDTQPVYIRSYQFDGSQVVPYAELIDISVNTAQRLEIPVRIVGNSNSDTIDLTFTDDPEQDTLNLAEWNDLYGNPSPGSIYVDTQLRYRFLNDDGSTAFTDPDTNHGKLELRRGNGVVNEYFDLLLSDLAGSWLTAPFIGINATPTYGQSFTFWIDETFNLTSIFKGTWKIGDVFRYYPLISNPENWIDFEVQDVRPTGQKYLDDQTKTFSLYDGNGSLFTPYSAKNLIITLDGVLQEPEVAYTVSGNQITFAKAPLGPNAKLTGSKLEDVTPYAGTTFYAKYFAFKDNQYNTKHFKKLRNIFQRSGRWLDSANQIERNRTFIVEEAIGYGREKHPSLDWSTKQDDYERDLGYILDAYEHDVRFGGNVKTVDYINLFDQDSDYDYITKNKTASLDIFKYATNLANLAIRNWDIVETGVTYIQGSTAMTVADTSRLAAGMHVSSGRAYPEGTKIVSIDSDTEITLSSAALSNSGGGGGAPQGTTSYSGTSGGNNIIVPTNTAAVEPGDTFAIEPGDTFIAPTSFSGSDTATFFFSGINSGTFYDASNLIEANKEYIQNEVSNFTFDNFTLTNVSQEKCKRDIGYLVDAMVYHLRLGGNEKVVEFARFYFTNAGYPYGEERTYLRSDEEKLAADYAWNLVGVYAKEAMRNALNAPTYPDSPDPVEDLTISVDTVFPYCAEVATAIDTMIDIVKDIVENGTGAVDPTPINASKPGNWTDTKPYTDYNLIPDSDLPYNGECDDVVSAVNSLYDAVDGILNSSVVARTLPDYVDGENKIFEMYWEDGSEVNTEEDEDLFLTINAVLQRPKYNADYPGEDSYYIDRTVIPNRLVFDVAPIWDQDFGAKSIGEPTAVEKVVGIGVGNYKRLTIDKNLVNGVRTGPFLILDVEDLTVQSIEDKEFLYVFLDGVLQREGYSYTVAGPNIYFNVPIKDEMKIDMRYLYGRDVGQILNLYDFAPDQFYTKASVVLQVPTGTGSFSSYAWMGDKIGAPIHAWQVRPDGTRNILGQLSNIAPYPTELAFGVFGFKCELDTSLPVTFAVSSDYSRTTTLSITDYTITYETDESGRTILSDNTQIWSGSLLRKTYRNPFLSLSNGDTIRVEGEDKFRRIKTLPSKTTSKEQRLQQQVSNSLFGSVDVERYNGITRGEGLSVVAIIENGSVVRLEWNQRSYEPLTQPTAYQYYTPPVLNFIPLDGNGGGARANVLVSKGQVISVDLIDGGSGYTEAPKVEVARRYDVLSDRDIGVSLVVVGVNPYVETQGLIIQSTTDVISLPPPLEFTSTAVIIESPRRVDIDLEEEIQLLRPVSEDLTASTSEVRSSRPNPDKFVVIDLFTATNQYLSQVSGRVEDIVSSSIVTANRQITSTVHNIIQNTSLSNINYYEVAAFLDVDADPADTIIYIADTSKFKTSGFLLIGDEVVRYMRKLSDRFLMVQRGQEGTVAKFWPAGTFIRQIPDPVSVAPGGIISIESEASVSIVGAATGVDGRTGQDRVRYEQVETPDVTLTTISREITAEVQPQLNVESIVSIDARVLYKLQVPFDITPEVSIQEPEVSEVKCEIQIVETEFNIRKEALELLLIPPPSGVIDGYLEDVFITDPVSTRLNGFVNIDDDYGVIKRDSTVIYVTNSVFGVGQQYIGDYTRTNAGHTISHFDGIFDDGSANVSGLSLLEFDTYFSAMTIRDFTERSDSSYTIAGSKFNLLPPSIQNPVTTSSSSGTIGGSIIVQSTAYFPAEGYLFTSGGTVIQYTSKTNTTFEGCTLYSGPNSIANADELVPFSID